MIPTLILGLVLPAIEVARSSAYAPGDGHNAGALACGGRLTRDQLHVAVRDWRLRGCGRRVVVCHARCVSATVQDSGPWGAVDETGTWRVWTRRLPRGWRRRADVDLSIGLWRAIGRPRTFERVVLAQ